MTPVSNARPLAAGAVVVCVTPRAEFRRCLPCPLGPLSVELELMREATGGTVIYQGEQAGIRIREGDSLRESWKTFFFVDYQDQNIISKRQNFNFETSNLEKLSSKMYVSKFEYSKLKSHCRAISAEARFVVPPAGPSVL